MSIEMKDSGKEWFHEDRFGMFIHWGLYSITARDMWYYSDEQVDKDYYERLFNRFNPVDYDPVEWAKLARKAGMKYGVFTAKHHDGFCLWDSKYTEFKVTNTKYGKDLLRMWIDAFRAEGLKVGLYYSLLDWNHPHFTVDYLHPQRHCADEINKDRDFTKYVEYLHDQVCELMTDYEKIDIFWPDFSYDQNAETGFPGKSATEWKSYELRDRILKLQPGILINDRLGFSEKKYSDFTTAEQYIPVEDISQKNAETLRWEACETMGASWGYYRGDNSIKPVHELIKHLVTCISNNGNLLLNVGPTPRGRIQPEFVGRLEEVGKWLEIYGESIYGAGSSEYKILSMGCPQVRVLFTCRGKDLYMHFLSGQYPSYNIFIKDLGGKVEYIEFVSDKTDIEFEEVELGDKRHIKLQMPVIQPDPYDTVIHIVLK